MRLWAIEIDPNLADAYVGRALAYLVQGDREAIDKAMVDINQALQHRPNYAVALTMRCLAYWGSNDRERAAQDCDAAVRSDPSFPFAYVVRGRICNLEGRFKDAIKEFENAVKVAPENAEIVNSLGVAHYRNEQFGEAINDFSEAIRHQKSELFFLNRGNAYAARGEAGDIARAIDDYKQAVALNPSSTGAEEMRRLIHFKEKECCPKATLAP